MYKRQVEIVGGEQYILSAVMHADEINRAMSEALGKDFLLYTSVIKASPPSKILFNSSMSVLQLVTKIIGTLEKLRI